MTNRAFIGTTGTGKSITQTAYEIQATISDNNAGIKHTTYTNYAIYNGNHNPDGKIPNLPKGNGTLLPGVHPIEDINLITDKEINHCGLILDEISLAIGADPRLTTSRQAIFYTRALANMRKKHVNLSISAQDPESQIDKRIRININEWITPLYSPPANLILQCVFYTLKRYTEATNNDTLLEDADEIRPFTNVSSYFPYYDTDQTFENYQQPYPLKKTATLYQTWANTQELPINQETLVLWLVATNQEPATSDQKKAILSHLKYSKN